MDWVLHLQKKKENVNFMVGSMNRLRRPIFISKKFVASYLTQVGPETLSISVIFLSKSSFHLHCNSEVKAFNLLSIIKMLKGQSKNALARLKTLADLYT